MKVLCAKRMFFTLVMLSHRSHIAMIPWHHRDELNEVPAMIRIVPHPAAIRTGTLYNVQIRVKCLCSV